MSLVGFQGTYRRCTCNKFSVYLDTMTVARLILSYSWCEMGHWICIQNAWFPGTYTRRVFTACAKIRIKLTHPYIMQPITDGPITLKLDLYYAVPCVSFWDSTHPTKNVLTCAAPPSWFRLNAWVPSWQFCWTSRPCVRSCIEHQSQYRCAEFLNAQIISVDESVSQTSSVDSTYPNHIHADLLHVEDNSVDIQLRLVRCTICRCF